MAIFASKEDFLSLGLEQIKPSHSHASQDCSICLDPLEVQPSKATSTTSKLHPAVRIFTCRHILGQECLSAWLDVSNTCPICKRYLFDVTDDALSQEDVDNVLSSLGRRFDEEDIMMSIGRIIATREKEHARLRDAQAQEVEKMRAKEQEERSSDEFVMSGEDFCDSAEEDFGSDEDMEGVEEDGDEDMEDDDDDDDDAFDPVD